MFYRKLSITLLSLFFACTSWAMMMSPEQGLEKLKKSPDYDYCVDLHKTVMRCLEYCKGQDEAWNVRCLTNVIDQDIRRRLLLLTDPRFLTGVEERNFPISELGRVVQERDAEEKRMLQAYYGLYQGYSTVPLQSSQSIVYWNLNDERNKVAVIEQKDDAYVLNVWKEESLSETISHQEKITAYARCHASDWLKREVHTFDEKVECVKFYFADQDSQTEQFLVETKSTAYFFDVSTLTQLKSNGLVHGVRRWPKNLDPPCIDINLGKKELQVKYPVTAKDVAHYLYYRERNDKKKESSVEDES